MALDDSSPSSGDDVVRVCVLKRGINRAMAGTHPKRDYTTVYVRKLSWDRLLGLAGGVERAATEACRAAAGRVSAAQVARAGNYTGAVLADAERSLRIASERALSVQMKLAAENNSAWS
jgi:hypothetical protein